MAEIQDELNLWQPLVIDLEQWPEGRGFNRVYINDPHRQSVLTKNLLGFRAMVEMYGADPNVIRAVDTVIKDFLRRFPEQLAELTTEEQNSDIDRRDYTPEPRMLHILRDHLEIDV